GEDPQQCGPQRGTAGRVVLDGQQQLGERFGQGDDEQGHQGRDGQGPGEQARDDVVGPLRARPASDGDLGVDDGGGGGLRGGHAGIRVNECLVVAGGGGGGARGHQAGGQGTHPSCQGAAGDHFEQHVGEQIGGGIGGADITGA